MLIKLGPFLLALLMFAMPSAFQTELTDQWIKLNTSVKKVLDQKTKEATDWLESAKKALQKGNLKEASHCMQQAVQCYTAILYKIDHTGDLDYKLSLKPLRAEVYTRSLEIQAEIRQLEKTHSPTPPAKEMPVAPPPSTNVATKKEPALPIPKTARVTIPPIPPTASVIHGEGFTLIRMVDDRSNDYQVCEKLYTYDEKGHVLSAEQTGPTRSLVKRNYSPTGDLILEEIFLNGKLIQQTRETHEMASRTLEIGHHKRVFTYHPDSFKLATLSTEGLTLTYDYRSDGSLIRPQLPFSHTPQTAKEMPQSKEIQGEEELDPWGNLIGYTTPSYSWKASYDAFGRRLQATYTEKGWLWNKEIVTTFIYDPEQPSEEIGLKVNGKTFWKLHGPTSCDALLDEEGDILLLFHDPHTNRKAVASPTQTYWFDATPSFPAGPPPTTLFELALNGH